MWADPNIKHRGGLEVATYYASYLRILQANLDQKALKVNPQILKVIQEPDIYIIYKERGLIGFACAVQSRR